MRQVGKVPQRREDRSPITRNSDSLPGSAGFVRDYLESRSGESAISDSYFVAYLKPPLIIDTGTIQRSKERSAILLDGDTFFSVCLTPKLAEHHMVTPSGGRH